MMNENIAGIARGKYIKLRYIDAISDKNKKKADNRSGREIANDIIAKSGIKLVKSNGN